jgi:hypothetical protein
VVSTDDSLVDVAGRRVMWSVWPDFRSWWAFEG